MTARSSRLPARQLALGPTLCLALLWGLAGCAQANVFGPRMTPTPTGGLRVVVRLECATGPVCDTPDDELARMKAALVVRAQRGLGASGATATTLSDSDIEIVLPGYTNQQLAVSALTAQGAVQFINTSDTPLAVGTTVAPNQYPILFTGAQIAPSSAQATLDQNNQPIVVFEFAGAARAQFATYTRDHVGDALTITQDNVVIESATIQSEIDGQGEITGLKSMTDAEALAVELKSVPLPEPVGLVSAQAYSG